MARRKNIILLQLGIAAIATSSLIGVVSCSENKNTTIEKNTSIELIKTNFNSNEFGFENKTTLEVKNTINEQWIYKNKEKIFKNIDFKEEDITNLNVEITQNNNINNLSIRLEIKKNIISFSINNLKVEEIQIELVKNKFEAKEFGFENKTAQETNKIINEDWIYSKRSEIFKQINFNKEDIKNIEIKIKNSYNLLISLKIKNYEHSFEIINFKKEQSVEEIQKYENLVEQIKNNIKLIPSENAFFDHKQITVDNFLDLDYQIQKKFFDFNWEELNNKFKNDNLWIESKNNELKIDYICEKISSTEINFEIKINIEQIQKTSLVKMSNFLDPIKNNISNKQELKNLIEQIGKEIDLIPSNNENDHTKITVEEYLKKSYHEQTQYFNLNRDELDAKFQQNDLYNNNTLLDFEINPNFEFDINNPTNLKFDIYIIISEKIDEYDGLPKNIQLVKKVEKTIYTFKEPIETISGLDKEPIKVLNTPSNAESYKGKLERFRMQDIKISSENNYIDLNRNMTWNDFKKEMMYQVRFALYQMFSDNFSEINYYTHNERENRSLTATGVGIIKEKRNDVSYYFQYLGSEHQQKTNVETGDRIEISITYSSNGENDWKPTMVSTSEGIINLGDLNWSFKNNCDNLNDPKDPLYLNKPFLSFFPRAQFVIKKNGKDLYNQTNNQYVVYSFIWKRRRYIG